MSTPKNFPLTGPELPVDFDSPITKDQLNGTQRPGDWFQTYTGKQFWLLDPRPEDICIEDIAHSLSMICRFGGHCNSFYSVAQHSIHVASIYGDLVAGTRLENERKGYLGALLHDASEAYVGDVILPLKRSIPEFEQAEAKVWSCILEHFGLTEVWPDVQALVKRADQIALATEKRDVVAEGVGTWKLEAGPSSSLRIVPHPASKPWFLRLYRQLADCGTL